MMNNKIDIKHNTIAFVLSIIKNSPSISKKRATDESLMKAMRINKETLDFVTNWLLDNNYISNDGIYYFVDKNNTRINPFLLDRLMYGKWENDI